jgi:hypothetical protein
MSLDRANEQLRRISDKTQLLEQPTTTCSARATDDRRHALSAAEPSDKQARNNVSKIP